MSNINDYLKKLGKIHKYEIVGNTKIIYTNKGTYCVKKQKRMDILEVHSYIKSKNYNNILNLEIVDGYEITPFIKDYKTPLEDRLTEGIYLISLLHNKTTFYKKFSLDEIKEIYEKNTDYILYVKDYYESLCYSIDTNTFLSPSDYLFVRNISVILLSLDRSKYYLDKWYEIVKNKNSKRCVLNHNNLSTSHILINDIPYLINFNESIFDSPVIDLQNIIRNNYKVMDIFSAYVLYTSKYPLLKEEVLMLFSLLLVPPIIKKEKIELDNVKEYYELFDYLDIVNKFISKNDLKDNK